MTFDARSIRGALALALLALLARPVIGQSGAAVSATRAMITDRPGNTDSPETVPAGWVQLEVDALAFATERSATTREESYGVFATNLKLGLTDDVDLQLVGTPYLRQTTRESATGAEESAEGASNLRVRAKWNLWGNDGSATALALIPFVTLPTGSREVASGAVEGGLVVPLGVDLGSGWSFGTQAVLELARDADDSGHELAFGTTAKLACALPGGWTPWAELFARVPEHSDEVVTADAGLAWQVTADVAVDATVFVGLNDAAPDVAAAIGFALRF